MTSVLVPHAGGKPPVGRMAEEVDDRPAAAAVSAWSEATRDLLAGLTSLERRWVEAFARGLNAASAYRHAAGITVHPDEPDHSRQYGYAIRTRPRVRLAVAAACRDVSAGPRLTRRQMITTLMAAIETCEGSNRRRDLRVLCRLLRLAADLGGHIPRGQRDQRRLAPQAAVDGRIQEVLASVRRQIEDRSALPSSATSEQRVEVPPSVRSAPWETQGGGLETCSAGSRVRETSDRTVEQTHRETCPSTSPASTARVAPPEAPPIPRQTFAYQFNSEFSAGRGGFIGVD